MKLKIKNLIKLMTKKKLIKVGIIGGGFGYYGHYKAFQKISSCKVVAIVTKKKLNLPKSTKIYNSVKKLITNEKLDLISIATIPKIQQSLFSQLIEYGANLFIEKPLPKKDMPASLSAASIVSNFVIDIRENWANSANKFFDGLAAGKPIFLNHGGWMQDLVLINR